MRRIVASLVLVAAVVAILPAGAQASQGEVLCGNFGGETMPPRLAVRPGRCDVTRLDGAAEVYALRDMRWASWGKRAVGRGLVNGRTNSVRFKRTRSCGQNGEYSVYSEMSIAGRPFRPILYCGD